MCLLSRSRPLRIRTFGMALGKAAKGDEERLDRLIRQDWAPLRIFLVAAVPGLRDQAEIVLKEFAEGKILKKDSLSCSTRFGCLNRIAR
jgi:hypothetical protein